MKLNKIPKLILVDRDGCINRKASDGEYVYKIEDFVIFPDVAKFFLDCENLEIRTAIITNQQGIGKGIYSELDVANLHSKFIEFCGLKNHLPSIHFCPHLQGTCDCRKPQPKLILEALRANNVAAEDAIFIGDSETDRQAATNAKVFFIEMRRDDSSAGLFEKPSITSFEEIDLGIGSEQ